MDLIPLAPFYILCLKFLLTIRVSDVDLTVFISY